MDIPGQIFMLFVQLENKVEVEIVEISFFLQHYMT